MKYWWLVLLITLASHVQAQTAKQCLASAIYHEARGEPALGKYYVGSVVLNRAGNPKNICLILKQPNQFPWYKKKSDLKKFDKSSIIVATQLLQGKPIPKVEYFHSTHLAYNKRAWTKNLKVVARVGNHIFYKD